MQKCKTTAPVIIRSGLFGLDKEQVKRRWHMLVKVKGGYNINQPIQFKAGEKFEYEGPVDRALASLLGLSDKQAEKMNRAHDKAQAQAVGDDSETARIAEEEAEAARIAEEEAEAARIAEEEAEAARIEEEEAKAVRIEEEEAKAVRATNEGSESE